MRKPNSLKILDSIRVDKPCHESWEQMSGDARSRFCAKCAHAVHDISAMTKEEAAVLLAQSSGKRVCVRYNVNSD